MIQTKSPPENLARFNAVALARDVALDRAGARRGGQWCLWTGDRSIRAAAIPNRRRKRACARIAEAMNRTQDEALDALEALRASAPGLAERVERMP